MQMWNQLSERFSALSQREKLLIMIGGAVGLFFILLTLLVDPVLAINKSSVKQVRSETLNVDRVTSELAVINIRLSANPDKELDEQIKQLKAQSDKLSGEMVDIVDSLITPSEMTVLLEQVLDSGSKLKLMALESLSPTPILTESDGAETGYYLHPVKIELTGRFFDIKAYLETLEQMPMKYYWRSFRYQVEEYPQARLIMEVYTLGTRQEFIGG